MLLKYREDLITCRVSLEHARETMGGEVAFLKSRLEAEQQERVVMEDTLTQELSQLQNQLGASMGCWSGLWVFDVVDVVDGW